MLKDLKEMGLTDGEIAHIVTEESFTGRPLPRRPRFVPAPRGSRDKAEWARSLRGRHTPMCLAASAFG